MCSKEQKVFILKEEWSYNCFILCYVLKLQSCSRAKSSRKPSPKPQPYRLTQNRLCTAPTKLPQSHLQGQRMFCSFTHSFTRSMAPSRMPGTLLSSGNLMMQKTKDSLVHPQGAFSPAIWKGRHCTRMKRVRAGTALRLMRTTLVCGWQWSWEGSQRKWHPR